jgi:FkbM family methyltransferase
LNVAANGDGLGDEWNSNGERMVFENIINSPTGGAILEVGAHDGSHTVAMIGAMRRYRGRVHTIHSFEPSAANAARWIDTIAKAGADECVVLNRAACSDSSGEAILRCRPGGGRNGFHETYAGTEGESTETVRTAALDEYAREAGLSELLLLKIDTEGHDLRVLRGALELLQSKQIQYVQFEYNSAWIASRHFLKDAFDLLLPLGYHIGKIHKTFIERFIEWDYRLEWFEHTNFVAWVANIHPLFPIEVTRGYLDHKSSSK